MQLNLSKVACGNLQGDLLRKNVENVLFLLLYDSTESL